MQVQQRGRVPERRRFAQASSVLRQQYALGWHLLGRLRRQY